MILIALGANLPGPHGTPEQTLVAAIADLRKKGLRVLRVSQFWLTEPVPVSDDPWYTNGVIAVETDLPVRALHKLLKSTEENFGRAQAGRNAPRILDLDLISYHDERISDEDLIVPHPRMEGRAFVLLPLREVAPAWQHPVSGKNIERLISEMPEGQRAVLVDKAA